MLEIGGRGRSAKLHFPTFEVERAWRADALEKPLAADEHAISISPARNEIELEFGAYEIITLGIEMRSR